MLTLASPTFKPSTAHQSEPDLRPHLIPPLTQLLRQLASVIQHLSDAQYTQKPVGVIESSVGGHVRHCLDHVRALLTAVDSGHLDYDHRERGTPIESLRAAALVSIAEMIHDLEALPRFVFNRPLQLHVRLAADAHPVTLLSTAGREIAYVLSHTIHHNAIVNAMVTTLGGWLPDRFGYAPSTLRNLEARACAR